MGKRTQQLQELSLEGPATQPSFSGTVTSTAPFVPADNPAPPPVSGLAIFRVAETGEPWRFDPINNHHLGLTDGRAIFLCGLRGEGKTAGAQMIGTALMARRYRSGLPCRVYIEIQRRNMGVAEMEKFVKAIGGEITPLKDRKINFLAEGLLSFGDTIYVTRTALEVNSGEKLTSRMRDGLKIAVAEMYTNKGEKPCPSHLSRKLREVTCDDVYQYRVSKKQVRSDRRNNRDEQMTVDAAIEVAVMVDNLMELSCIGDDLSLKDAMSQDCFAPDFTDLTDEEIVIVQIYLWRIRMHAIAVMNRELYFNLEIHDENYRMVQFLPYTKGMVQLLKAIRGVDTVIIVASHRPNDYRSVAPEGSTEFNQAMALLLEYDTVLAARMPEEDRSDMMRYFGFTHAHFDIVKSLPQWGRQWVLKFRGEEDIHKLLLRLTSGVKETSYSQQATDNDYIPA